MAQQNTSSVDPVADPRFAQRASELLASGDVSGALDLAFAGAEKFPWYATGQYILGTCYEEAGQILDALAVFRRAHQFLPDSPVIANAIERLESQRETGIDNLEPRIGEGDTVVPDESLDIAPGDEEKSSALDDLEAQLRNARKIVPDQSFQDQQQPGTGDDEDADSSRMVSRTLAEIYVQQEQYGEAIRAYRALIEENPDEEEVFSKRIEEIEELIRKQLFG
jgi:tetratricopeptide (TPR) repeat protein